jgi:hypothetical protein
MPDSSHPFGQLPSRQVTTSRPSIDTLQALAVVKRGRARERRIERIAGRYRDRAAQSYRRCSRAATIGASLRATSGRPTAVTRAITRPAMIRARSALFGSSGSAPSGTRY